MFFKPFKGVHAGAELLGSFFRDSAQLRSAGPDFHADRDRAIHFLLWVTQFYKGDGNSRR
jgi:hypothetical protein